MDNESIRSGTACTYREVSVSEPTVVIYSQVSLPQFNDSSSVSEPHSGNVKVSPPTYS